MPSSAREVPVNFGGPRGRNLFILRLTFFFLMRDLFVGDMRISGWVEG